jgi:hypothetical protein
MSTAMISPGSTTNLAAAHAPGATRHTAGMAVAVQLGQQRINRKRVECS